MSSKKQEKKDAQTQREGEAEERFQAALDRAIDADIVNPPIDIWYDPFQVIRWGQEQAQPAGPGRRGHVIEQFDQQTQYFDEMVKQHQQNQ